jgi:GntR family transcriptional regulator/MocR family aminotransferase
MDHFPVFQSLKAAPRGDVQKRLMERIRTAILSGELPEAAVLPPTRQLADQLGIARGTVVSAYENLHAEGFLSARQGSRTVVARGTQYKDWQRPPRTTRDGTSHSSDSALRHDRPDIPLRRRGDLIDFTAGIPDLPRFPRSEWARAQRTVLREYPAAVFSYGPLAGAPELRASIAGSLLRAKGIRCTEKNVFIVAGSIEGFHLMARLAAHRGLALVCEDPCYDAVPRVFAGVSRLLPVPVDDNGLRTDRLPPGRTMIYTTPSHQYPLGATLSVQRRIELVEHARKNDCLIIEDDYDGEFRFAGPQVPSLALLAPDHVLHCGTFSKTLSAALRIGYIAAPASLCDEIVRLQKNEGRFPSLLQQYALLEFLRTGFERHLNRKRKLYALKALFLAEEIERRFHGSAVILGASTGMHAVVRFPGRRVGDSLMRRIAARGVRVERVSDYCISASGHRNELVLGYGNLTMDEIQAGIGAISAAFAL